LSLKGRDFLTLKELSAEEVHLILARAADMKGRQAGDGILAGRLVALLFSKPSTRTRVSFEAGVRQLGGSTIFLDQESVQVGRGETLADTGRVLSLYTDALVVRTYRQSDLDELAGAASVPVINALTDDYHPCQILADLLTFREIWGSLAGLRLAYVGDGNNVANTLVVGCAITGIELRLACPRGYEVAEERLMEARSRWSAKIAATVDPLEAVEGADAIYTDTWASMGQEDEREARLRIFRPYQVNTELLRAADRSAKVFHCLPAHRGEEISAEVMDGPQSAVWQQAENRLHAQKGLLSLLMP